MSKRKRPAPILKLEKAISRASKVPIKEIQNKTKVKAFVETRHVVWFIAHDLMDYGYNELGRLYGFDHTTVMHGCQKIRESGKVMDIIAGIKKSCPGLILDNNRISNWEFEEKSEDVDKL